MLSSIGVPSSSIDSRYPSPSSASRCGVRGVPLALVVRPIAAGAEPVAQRRHGVRRQPEHVVAVVVLGDPVGLRDAVQRRVLAGQQRRAARRARRRHRIVMTERHPVLPQPLHAGQMLPPELGELIGLVRRRVVLLIGQDDQDVRASESWPRHSRSRSVSAHRPDRVSVQRRPIGGMRRQRQRWDVHRGIEWQLLVLALEAALYPTLLAAVVILLSQPRRKPLLTAYLAGGLTISIGLGLAIIAALKGSGAVDSSSSARAGSPTSPSAGWPCSLAVALATRADARYKERRQAKHPPQAGRSRRGEEGAALAAPAGPRLGPDRVHRGAGDQPPGRRLSRRAQGHRRRAPLHRPRTSPSSSRSTSSCSCWPRSRSSG